MTRKQRRMLLNTAAFISAGPLVLYSVPTLINSHDSIALICALLLGVGWLGWAAYILYEFNREIV